MREFKSLNNNCKQKVYVEGTPLISLMSKQEKDLFVAILELEARDYYKGQVKNEDGNKFGQPP